MRLWTTYLVHRNPLGGICMLWSNEAIVEVEDFNSHITAVKTFVIGFWLVSVGLHTELKVAGIRSFITTNRGSVGVLR